MTAMGPFLSLIMFYTDVQDDIWINERSSDLLTYHGCNAF